MNILYADDTYAKASAEDQARSIHLFGGITINRDIEQPFIEAIRGVKRRYTHPNMPFKWNFKDTAIRNKFEEFKREAEYQKMLAESREWRLDLFRVLDDFDYRVLISCIQAFGGGENRTKQVKADLNTYCFENVLMRVALDAKEVKGHWQCVLDWPPDGDSKPFDRGYYQLFHFGKGSSTQPCFAGSLEHVGFSHSLHYTRCNHSPMMQFTDLVLGATRDHIECQIEQRGSSVGTEAVEIFYDHFRNLNGLIPRYGVTASTGSTALVANIERIFNKKANQRFQPIGGPRPPQAEA